MKEMRTECFRIDEELDAIERVKFRLIFRDDRLIILFVKDSHAKRLFKVIELSPLNLPFSLKRPGNHCVLPIMEGIEEDFLDLLLG